MSGPLGANGAQHWMVLGRFHQRRQSAQQPPCNTGRTSPTGVLPRRPSSRFVSQTPPGLGAPPEKHRCENFFKHQPHRLGSGVEGPSPAKKNPRVGPDERFQHLQITFPTGGSSSTARCWTLRQEMASKPFNFITKKSRKKRRQACDVAFKTNHGSNPHQATLKGGLHGRLNRVVAW